MPDLYFEDFAVGEVTSFGHYPVTREEVIAFASQFDPQPMHLDEEAAAHSMLGGLSASGWHTCSMLMRMIADSFLLRSSGMGAPGVDHVRWLKPVRVGDVLSVRRTTLDARPSATRQDRGYVKFRFEVLNQDGDVVLEQQNSVIFGTRAGAAA